MAWAVILSVVLLSAVLVRLARGPFRLEDVIDAVGAWDPGRLDHQQALANSLAAHLRRGGPGWKVQLLDGDLDETVDLALESGGRKVAVRIQLGLLNHAEYRRLASEMGAARKTWGTVVLVVCGETDPALRYQLEDRLPGREGTSVIRLVFKDPPPRSRLARAA